MAQFEIRQLTFSYPEANKETLQKIDMTIAQGEYIVFCGRSGSGKTTLLRHLKPALTPHGTRSGSIQYQGEAIEKLSPRRQSSEIGYVMQQPDQQIVTDKVWHELAFGLESLGCEQKTMRLRVAEMASYFGIQDWFHKDVQELSGGQKQLLNLASIMAMQPSVLILDEPTSQLDPIAATDFLNTLRKINQELGTTILLSEHRLEEVVPVADRVIVLEQGRIVADERNETISERLLQQKHPMFEAMPTPARIYHMVPKVGACPLSVRDGRSWLTKYRNQYPAKNSANSYDVETLPNYEEPEEVALKLKEVWFRYDKQGKDVLRDASIEIRKGSIHAIVGGNGTGKSTLLKVMCGVCRPYRGKVVLLGKKLSTYKASELYRDGIAMLPQDPQSLFVKNKVEDELDEMCQSTKAAFQEEKQRVVKSCNIEHLLNSHPYDLSGGEQQRVALAKVLLCKPKVLLLDEPTKGMDAVAKKELAAFLQELKEEGVTIVLVSHDVEFCAAYTDEVSMCFDGGIVTTNTPKRFFANNSFYTTAASRMSRHLANGLVTTEDVITFCKDGIA